MLFCQHTWIHRPVRLGPVMNSGRGRAARETVAGKAQRHLGVPPLQERVITPQADVPRAANRFVHERGMRRLRREPSRAPRLALHPRPHERDFVLSS
jgi:hypothetical protein